MCGELTVSVMGHPDWEGTGHPEWQEHTTLIMLKSRMKIGKWKSILWVLMTLKRNEGTVNQGYRNIKAWEEMLAEALEWEEQQWWLAFSHSTPSPACGAQKTFSHPRSHSRGVVTWGWCGRTPPWGVCGAPAHSAVSVGAGSSKGSSTAAPWTPPCEPLQLVMHSWHWYTVHWWTIDMYAWLANQQTAPILICL